MRSRVSVGDTDDSATDEEDRPTASMGSLANPFASSPAKKSPPAAAAAAPPSLRAAQRPSLDQVFGATAPLNSPLR